jgi:hypothetical protein
LLQQNRNPALFFLFALAKNMAVFVVFFILPNEAYLQTLYDDPGFTPIIAGQKARQARERNRFLSIVCTDNPYEEVWQPAEGTCERFAAEQKH